TNLKPVNWTEPSDMKTLPAFVVRNHIHYGDIEPSPTNDLFPSWYTPRSTSSSSQTIDKVSGKIATACTPNLAKDVQSNGNASTWNVDIFAGGSLGSNSATPTTAAQTDDVHNCSDVKPSVTLTAPSTCDTIDPCTLTATVTQGTFPLSGDKFQGVLNFIVNGQ